MTNPFGFRPARHLNGSNTFRVRPYPVDNSNPHDLFVGHAVVLSSGKVIEATANETAPILGVITAIAGSTTDKRRPRLHQLPSGTMRLALSTAGYVYVCDDPDVIFEVVADSAANLSDVGQIGTIVATGSGNPTTGISLMSLDASSVVAETTANSDTLSFKFVGISPRERTDTFADRQVVEVIINNHQFGIRG